MERVSERERGVEERESLSLSAERHRGKEGGEHCLRRRGSTFQNTLTPSNCQISPLNLKIFFTLNKLFTR
jgi:hypothetical protein